MWEARHQVARSVFRYSSIRPEIDHPPLLLGQHTDAILAEHGYDAARITALRDEGGGVGPSRPFHARMTSYESGLRR